MVQTPTTLETRGAELPVWSWERVGLLSSPGERCHLSIHRPAKSNLKQKARLARSSTHTHPRRCRGSREGHEPCALRELPGGGKRGETIQNSTRHCLGFLFVLFSPTPPLPGSLRLHGARRAGWTDRRSPPPGPGSLSLPGDRTRETGGVQAAPPAAQRDPAREGGREAAAPRLTVIRGMFFLPW